MKTSRRVLGNRGENEACGFLKEKGHSILERNWIAGHLEIDIISLDREGLHFVEVKSRTAPITAEPEENVTVLKQKRICAAALKYINRFGGSAFSQDIELFFDVITVVFDGSDTHIAYYPQAFIPIYV